MSRWLFLIVLLCVAAGFGWRAFSLRPVAEVSDAIAPVTNLGESSENSADGRMMQLVVTTPAATKVPAAPEEDWGVNWKDDRRPVMSSTAQPASRGVIVGARSSPGTVLADRPDASDQIPLAADDGRAFFSDDVAVAPPAVNGSSNGSGNIGGYRGAQVATGAGPATPTPVRTAAKADQAALPWVRGQARGYAMLYAMHPAARALVEQQVKALLDARIRQPYIGVLVDGTFGQDFDYLKDIVRRLSTEGRALTLVLYLTNGPTMRKWDTTPIDVLFNKIEPGLFRDLIVNDQAIRNRYAGVIARANDIFAARIISDPESRNVAIVMLEDNLDHRSYAAMRSQAASRLGSDVTFIRNPCVGCYSDGLSDGDPQGDGVEVHSPEKFRELGEGDGFTLDGTGFEYPNADDVDSETSSSVSSDGVLQMMNQAAARKLAYAGLWRHAWQGVKEGVANKHPDKRTYMLSNASEIDFEISALRQGLELEAP